jgi:hypothetical protein
MGIWSRISRVKAQVLHVGDQLRRGAAEQCQSTEVFSSDRCCKESVVTTHIHRAC